MRGFLNVGIVCRLVSSEIVSFHVCTTKVDKFEKIYRSNSSAIGAGSLFDSDIV